MEKIQNRKYVQYSLALDIYSVYFEREKAGRRKNLSYKVTPSVDSLGLSQYQYLTYSSQPLPSSPSQVKSPSTTPYLHIPNPAHSNSATSSSRVFPRSPLEWLAFPLQFIFCTQFKTAHSTMDVF